MSFDIQVKLYYILGLVAAVGACLEYVFVTFQVASREQKALQVMSTCTVLLSLGDAITIVTQNPNSCAIGLLVSYFGGAFIGYGFIMLLGLLAHVEIPFWTKCTMIVGNGFFIAMEVLNSKTQLMYKKTDYDIVSYGANLRRVEYGPVFNVYIVWYFATMLVPILILILCALKQRHVFKSMFKCLLLYTIAGFVAFGSFIVSTVFKTRYDFSAIGCFLSLAMMLYVVYHYRAFPMAHNSEDTILDSLEDILISYDTRGQFIYANKKAKEIIDPDKRFVYGANLWSMDERITEFMKLEEGDSFSFEGRTYVTEIIDVHRKGKMAAYVKWLRDVTKENTYIEEAVRLKNEADAANQAKSSFLAHMSHEIRTPMNAVLGMDELILRENSNPQITEYAESIKRGGKTLLSIINDILDFSKIEAGKMNIVEDEYYLKNTINDLAEMTKVRAEEKGLKINVLVNPDIPARLYGDEVRVKQIITNLLTNAVKYTEKGSVNLSVDYQMEEDGSLKVIALIEDTGIGIKEEDMDKLYGSFERIENASNHKTEGTGLGMSITLKLLALMGGELKVESEYGTGSKFTAIIPQRALGSEKIGSLEDNLREEKKKETGISSFATKDASVLIVDDNKVNLIVAKSLLKNTGISVDTALSGYECLDKIKKKHYDILLIDNRMPELSGIETLKLILEDKSHMCVGVPTVALTADASEGAKTYFENCGFSDYLSKPINPELYEKMILRLLPGEKVFEANPNEEWNNPRM